MTVIWRHCNDILTRWRCNRCRVNRDYYWYNCSLSIHVIQTIVVRLSTWFLGYRGDDLLWAYSTRNLIHPPKWLCDNWITRYCCEVTTISSVCDLISVDSFTVSLHRHNGRKMTVNNLWKRCKFPPVTRSNKPLRLGQSQPVFKPTSYKRPANWIPCPRLDWHSYCHQSRTI